MNSVALGKNVFLQEINADNFFVFNSKNKKSYEIGRTEFETLKTMERKQSFDELYENNKTRMTKEQLAAFCKTVSGLGLLEGSKTENKFHLTRIKFGLINPSKYLSKDSLFIKFMYFFLTKMPFIALAMGIVSLLVTRDRSLFEKIMDFDFSVSNVVFSVIMMFTITAFHEAGHMCMAIHYGIPVPEIGVMLYWFAPAAYADVSAIHFIKDKGKKIHVLMAGIYTHLVWIGLGIFAFNIFPEWVDYTIPFVVINMALILANITFYLKLDGYHILTTVTDNPLLRENSLNLLLNKEFRKSAGVRMSYGEIVLHICVAFISVIYIPALVMSGIFRLVAFFMR